MSYCSSLELNHANIDRSLIIEKWEEKIIELHKRLTATLFFSGLRKDVIINLGDGFLTLIFLSNIYVG